MGDAITRDEFDRWMVANHKTTQRYVDATGVSRVWYSFDSEIDTAFDGSTLDTAGMYVCPVGRDGRPIRPGESVFGGDGQRWVVAAVSDLADSYDVWGHKPGKSVGAAKPMRSAWLTHEAPSRSPAEIARVMRMVADSGPAGPETLRRWATELEGGREE